MVSLLVGQAGNVDPMHIAVKTTHGKLFNHLETLTRQVVDRRGRF
jgi:hypothetical protein